jgi:hypothetical protein
VSAHALTSSCVQLRVSADQLTSQPSHLLRFYSVECGLKAALLRRRSLRSTGQLDQDLRSHNLRRLARELNLDQATYANLRRCRQRSHDSRDHPVEVHEVHEAWRYGAGLDGADEQEFVAGLRSLERWCRKELGR